MKVIVEPIALPDRVLLEFKCELMDTYGSLSHVHHIETRRQVVLPQYSLQMRREAEQMVFTRTMLLQWLSGLTM